MKRPMMWSAGAVAALVLLSGCSSAAKPSGEGATTKLNVAYWPGAELKAMQPLVEHYNATQGKKDGISVELTTFSANDMFNKELVEMNTKSSTLDMYFVASYLLGQHAPYLEPLEGADASGLLPSAVDAFSQDGNLYAVPLDVGVIGTVYRTDLIEPLLTDESQQQKFGEISQQLLGKKLEPKDPNDWGWDDYLATAAYFTKKYNPASPTEYGTILPLLNGPFAGLQWSGVLASNGGSWVDGEGNPTFDTPEAVAAVNVYAKAMEYGVASPNSTQGNATSLNAALTSGAVAFEMQWYSSMSGFDDASAAPLTAGKVAFTRVPGEHKGHMHVQGVAVNKYGKNIEATKKFAAFLMTEDALTMYGNGGGSPPAIAYLESSPKLETLLSVVRDSSYSEPSIGKASAWSIATEVSKALSNAWIGKQDAAQATAQLQAAVEKLSGK